MLAYKGFGTGLVCRGYKFREGKKHEEKEANCARNGFHCASNPMDCLYYYPNFKESVYCIVNAGGDIDEDGNDSKIACTELTIVRVLTPEEYLLQIVKYIAKNKEARKHGNVKSESGDASGSGYAVVVGNEPRAKGQIGDWLAMLKLTQSGQPAAVSIVQVDGERIRPGVYYDAYGEETRE